MGKRVLRVPFKTTRAPFLCALIAIRRRSQKRNAFEGNGTAADVNSKERERESLHCTTPTRAGFDRRLSRTRKRLITLCSLSSRACVFATTKRKMQTLLEKKCHARAPLSAISASSSSSSKSLVDGASIVFLLLLLLSKV